MSQLFDIYQGFKLGFSTFPLLLNCSVEMPKKRGNNWTNREKPDVARARWQRRLDHILGVRRPIRRRRVAPSPVVAPAPAIDLHRRHRRSARLRPNYLTQLFRVEASMGGRVPMVKLTRLSPEVLARFVEEGAGPVPTVDEVELPDPRMKAFMRSLSLSPRSSASPHNERTGSRADASGSSSPSPDDSPVVLDPVEPQESAPQEGSSVGVADAPREGADIVRVSAARLHGRSLADSLKMIESFTSEYDRLIEAQIHSHSNGGSGQSSDSAGDLANLNNLQRLLTMPSTQNESISEPDSCDDTMDHSIPSTSNAEYNTLHVLQNKVHCMSGKTLKDEDDSPVETVKTPLTTDATENDETVVNEETPPQPTHKKAIDRLDNIYGLLNLFVTELVGMGRPPPPINVEINRLISFDRGLSNSTSIEFYEDIVFTNSTFFRTCERNPYNFTREIMDIIKLGNPNAEYKHLLAALFFACTTDSTWEDCVQLFHFTTLAECILAFHNMTLDICIIAHLNCFLFVSVVSTMIPF